MMGIWREQVCEENICMDSSHTKNNNYNKIYKCVVLQIITSQVDG